MSDFLTQNERNNPDGGIFGEPTYCIRDVQSPLDEFVEMESEEAANELAQSRSWGEVCVGIFEDYGDGDKLLRRIYFLGDKFEAE